MTCASIADSSRLAKKKSPSYASSRPLYAARLPSDYLIPLRLEGKRRRVGEIGVRGPVGLTGCRKEQHQIVHGLIVTRQERSVLLYSHYIQSERRERPGEPLE
jgi:hypothetical protein